MKPKKGNVMWVHVDGPGKGHTVELPGACSAVSEHKPEMIPHLLAGGTWETCEAGGLHKKEVGK